MAKITDYNLIADTIAALIEEKCPDLVAYVGRSNAIFCVMGIYTANNVMSGYGQDFTISDQENLFSGPKKVSVIAFTTGVSVVLTSRASQYRDRFPMCGYESLEDDLIQIMISIQAAIDRMNS